MGEDEGMKREGGAAEAAGAGLCDWEGSGEGGGDCKGEAGLDGESELGGESVGVGTGEDWDGGAEGEGEWEGSRVAENAGESLHPGLWDGKGDREGDTEGGNGGAVALAKGLDVGGGEGLAAGDMDGTGVRYNGGEGVGRDGAEDEDGECDNFVGGRAAWEEGGPGLGDAATSTVTGGLAGEMIPAADIEGPNTTSKMIRRTTRTNSLRSQGFPAMRFRSGSRVMKVSRSPMSKSLPSKAGESTVAGGNDCQPPDGLSDRMVSVRWSSTVVRGASERSTSSTSAWVKSRTFASRRAWDPHTAAPWVGCSWYPGN